MDDRIEPGSIVSAGIAGPGLARRLILGAEVVDGRTALELGLVQWAVPRAELGETARALAQRIAALPRQALAAAKPCIAAAVTASADGFELELAHTRELYRHPDTRARVTAFLARDARPTPPSPSKASTS